MDQSKKPIVRNEGRLIIASERRERFLTFVLREHKLENSLNILETTLLPLPNPTFCPKWEVILLLVLGRDGWAVPQNLTPHSILIQTRNFAKPKVITHHGSPSQSVGGFSLTGQCQKLKKHRKVCLKHVWKSPTYDKQLHNLRTVQPSLLAGGDLVPRDFYWKDRYIVPVFSKKLTYK